MSRTSLDERWVVTTYGGIDKVTAFLTLFPGSQLHIAVVLDFVASQKGAVSYLRDSELLRRRHVLTIDRYAERKTRKQTSRTL